MMTGKKGANVFTGNQAGNEVNPPLKEKELTNRLRDLQETLAKLDRAHHIPQELMKLEVSI